MKRLLRAEKATEGSIMKRQLRAEKAKDDK
jgi:hypothetical protein